MRLGDRQAGAKIEVTPEMRDAGARELVALLDGLVSEMTPFSNGKIVTAVFCSMVEASRKR